MSPPPSLFFLRLFLSEEELKMSLSSFFLPAPPSLPSHSPQTSLLRLPLPQLDFCAEHKEWADEMCVVCRVGKMSKKRFILFFFPPPLLATLPRLLDLTAPAAQTRRATTTFVCLWLLSLSLPPPSPLSREKESQIEKRPLCGDNAPSLQSNLRRRSFTLRPPLPSSILGGSVRRTFGGRGPNMACCPIYSVPQEQ